MKRQFTLNSLNSNLFKTDVHTCKIVVNSKNVRILTLFVTINVKNFWGRIIGPGGKTSNSE